MGFFLDPANLAGFITLIILEMILGIDNLIFIVILSEKLPTYQRDKARCTGLILALFMRFSLLSLVSWMISCTKPIVINKFFVLSVHDIILLVGGLFLLLKSIIELYEHLSGSTKNNKKKKKYANFWFIVIQIVILDAIFSLDSIITAIGIVNNLFITMCAITISTILMIFLSKLLINFITVHKNIIVLCLSFLLMIGINLITESLGFYIPKGYVYTAVSFSIIIEFFNQIAKRNLMLEQSKIPIRFRISEEISKLILYEEEKIKNKKNQQIKQNKFSYHMYSKPISKIEIFKEEEKHMIISVLNLGIRSIYSIMTPRHEISWININDHKDIIRMNLLNTPHNLFPVCKNELDNIIGIVRAKELLEIIDKKKDIFKFSSKIPPIIIPDTLDSIKLLSILRHAKGNLVIVSNEFGIIQGLITPVDVLEAIVGKFPDADETLDVIKEKNGWLVKGSINLHTLAQILNKKKIIQNENYTSLAGLLISYKGKFPKKGEVIYISPFYFNIIEATRYQIHLIRITKDKI